MHLFQSGDGEVFELAEEVTRDNSNDNKSTLPSWMIGAGLLVCVGAVIAMASSATSRSNNPLPETEMRLPSTRELVEVRGVSYDLARRLRAVMDSPLNSLEKEQRIADLLDTDTLLVEVDDAPSLTFETRVLGKGVASMINPGDTHSPTIAHVYRDLWVQLDPRSNRWKKLVAGGWYITNWETLTRSRVRAPQKTWAKNPVDEFKDLNDVVDLNALEAKLQKELQYLRSSQVSMEAQEQRFEEILDLLSMFQNRVEQGRISLTRNGEVVDEDINIDACEMVLSAFIKEAISIVDVPSRIISSSLGNWVFDEMGRPLSDLVARKPTFELYLYQEPLLNSFLMIVEKVSANTHNQEMLDVMASIYLPLVENVANDVDLAHIILSNIASNSSTTDETLEKLVQSSSEEVLIALVERKTTPKYVIQQIQEKSKNSYQLDQALLDRQVREQVRVIDSLS